MNTHILTKINLHLEIITKNLFTKTFLFISESENS